MDLFITENYIIPYAYMNESMVVNSIWSVHKSSMSLTCASFVRLLDFTWSFNNFLERALIRCSMKDITILIRTPNTSKMQAPLKYRIPNCLWFSFSCMHFAAECFFSILSIISLSLYLRIKFDIDSFQGDPFLKAKGNHCLTYSCN